MTEGHLYVITNKSYPGWVKVGITKNLKRRLQTYQTCSPHRDYELVFSVWHPNAKSAERKIKEMMQMFATNSRNEWYQVDLEVAKVRLEEQLLEP